MHILVIVSNSKLLMPNKIILKKKIPNFSQNISIPGDKSISIRWV